MQLGQKSNCLDLMKLSAGQHKILYFDDKSKKMALFFANYFWSGIFARMDKGRTILKQAQFALTIERLCHQLIEEYDDFTNACLIGIQPRGILLADRIHERLIDILKNTTY